ncbi:lipoyl(octanoyl) transferase LipB [Larsenimonas rhizosphaerae]|uniref:lipoyl(octanoyl) transferase LipB n=1 Tax=Larsenimonas rhizosphaerae TaxID=2944682 RepID=UPI0038996607
MSALDAIEVFCLGRRSYEPVWAAMKAYTDTRGDDDPDQIWVVEHDPVFTQGQSGKAEHILASTGIPLVQTDRGGQVTYHGPGQLVMYPLINLRRRGVGVRDMVSALEQCVVESLADHGISAAARPDAPGVYVNQCKIASLGLRVRKGASYHGVAYNLDMDLTPFSAINPCGYAGLQMTQLADLITKAVDQSAEMHRVLGHLAHHLNDASWVMRPDLPAALADTFFDTGQR